MVQRLLNLVCLFIAVACAACASVASAQPRHNVLLFIPDGLRALMVNEQNAPTMAALRDEGVDFRNPHSLFPTFTTPNAAAMATGHYLGDTGDFSNTIYSGFPVPGAGGSLTPFLESDPVLGDVDEHFAGDYLDEVTLLKAARSAGLSTATVGKLGPALIFDHTERSGESTIVIDDSTGSKAGIPLSAEMQNAMTAAELPLSAPSRGENGKAGNATTPGTTVANTAQQAYFVDVATKVILPMFKARNQPFVMVFWSRDPDGTQHNQGDSLNELQPGINGATSLAAIRNADDNLRRIRDALANLGLDQTTDIFVTADHGFATISKQSKTSHSAAMRFGDVPDGFLPPGFVAIDLASALGMPVYDPDAKSARIDAGHYPSRSNGLIGADPTNPDVVVAANGGSDLVYLPKRDRKLARRVVKALLAQDYVSGLFVDESLGHYAGTLPISTINLKGSALTPIPAIVVNFRTFSTGCEQPVLCTVEIADTALQQGQGMHGSFSRADTMNFMAAIGPDFKRGYADNAPASNADVGRTLAQILGLNAKDHGKLVGRVLTEALVGGTETRYVAKVVRSGATPEGLRTVVNYQQVGNTLYFDAAGLPGRTVGLSNGVAASTRLTK